MRFVCGRIRMSSTFITTADKKIPMESREEWGTSRVAQLRQALPFPGLEFLQSTQNLNLIAV